MKEFFSTVNKKTCEKQIIDYIFRTTVKWNTVFDGDLFMIRVLLFRYSIQSVVFRHSK